MFITASCTHVRDEVKARKILYLYNVNVEGGVSSVEIVICKYRGGWGKWLYLYIEQIKYFHRVLTPSLTCVQLAGINI